jgi:hypothetical protein
LNERKIQFVVLLLLLLSLSLSLSLSHTHTSLAILLFFFFLLLPGDSVNRKPPEQEEREKRALKGDAAALEVFRASNGYPEIDRANRHTVAQAVVQALLRPSYDYASTSASAASKEEEDDAQSKLLRGGGGEREKEMIAGRSGGSGCCPREFTVLSKCDRTFPTNEEWEEMFMNPKGAPWPLPS